MTCCHLMDSPIPVEISRFLLKNLTGSVHSVLLRLDLCFLKSSAMTETGRNLVEQGHGYTEDASTHPSQALSIFAAWL